MADNRKITCTEMQQLCKEYKLPTTGKKAELEQRLQVHFKGDGWVRKIIENRAKESGVILNDSATRGVNDESIINQSGHFEDAEDVDENDRRALLMDIKLLEEKKRIMQREYEMQQREMQLIRREQQVNLAETPEFSNSAAGSTNSSSINANIKMISELISDFDGNAKNFEVWEKQILLTKEAYNISDDVAKILISMKLKGKAMEWFHSKAEHIALPFDNILIELKRMFCSNQCKVELRRKFETRKWKKEETFREYAHEKIILGNRVPISDEEMLIYLIDGIPDKALYYQARTQRFKQKEDLLDAFGDLTLQDYKVDQNNSATTSTLQKADIKQHTSKYTKCFNCGMNGHISANCRTKDLGPKCFKCNKHGHLATVWSNKGDTKNKTYDKVCSTAAISTKKYTKLVKIGGHALEALVDTGSDLTLMREDVYRVIGSPPLTKTEIRFTGVDSPILEAIGEFETILAVDNFISTALIRVVSKRWCTQKLIIGADVLAKTNFKTKRGEIYFEGDGVQDDEENDDVLPEIFQIAKAIK